MIDLTPQPVWINGKLVAPKGWISHETRELMRRASTAPTAIEVSQGDFCHRPAPESSPSAPEDTAQADPWAPEALGELR